MTLGNQSIAQEGAVDAGSLASADLHLAHWPLHAPHHLDYPATSLDYNLEVSARRYPDKPCLVFYGTVLTYSQVFDQVQRLAAFLQTHCDVQRGDRVLLNLQNSPQFVIGFYAILRAGAMVVPVNPMSKTIELKHYVHDSGARCAIVAQDVMQWLLPLVGTDQEQLNHVIVARYGDLVASQFLQELTQNNLPIPEFFLIPKAIWNPDSTEQIHCTAWLDAIACAAAWQNRQCGPQDRAVLPYTSGSTGLPKGCLHLHRSMVASTMLSSAWKQTLPESVSLATAPYFHVTGMVNSMNLPLYKGNTIVILPRWNPAVAAFLIERYRCNTWANVPTMVVDLLTNPQCAQYDISSLTAISGGGAAMPAAIAQRLQDEFGLVYMEGYGMTEFMAATHVNPPQRCKKQCLGIPHFDTHARVIDPDTLKPLGPNMQGEIIMSGPQQMVGYWNQKEQTEQGLVVIDGITFFRSGDLGYYDEDGYYFISDRLKRMINASGFKVWPAEVEAFFYQHPAIRECCIIASPDPRKGEVVKLVAVLKADAKPVSFEEMTVWAREIMANYKVPAIVEWVEQLPRTSSGKIFWRQLQDEAFGRAAKQ